MMLTIELYVGSKFTGKICLLQFEYLYEITLEFLRFSEYENCYNISKLLLIKSSPFTDKNDLLRVLRHTKVGLVIQFLSSMFPIKLKYKCKKYVSCLLSK